MTIITRTLLISVVLFLVLTLDFINDNQPGVTFVTEAEAWIRGPVGVGGVGVAGVARRTTRRVAIGTTAVVTSSAVDSAAASPDVVVVNQTPQATPQSGEAVPLGTTILALPNSCSSVSKSGNSYFNCDGVYYQPSYQGNKLVYVVVSAP